MSKLTSQVTQQKKPLNIPARLLPKIPVSLQQYLVQVIDSLISDLLSVNEPASDNPNYSNRSTLAGCHLIVCTGFNVAAMFVL